MDSPRPKERRRGAEPDDLPDAARVAADVVGKDPHPRRGHQQKVSVGAGAKRLPHRGKARHGSAPAAARAAAARPRSRRCSRRRGSARCASRCCASCGGASRRAGRHRPVYPGRIGNIITQLEMDAGLRHNRSTVELAYKKAYPGKEPGNGTLIGLINEIEELFQ